MDLEASMLERIEGWVDPPSADEADDAEELARYLSDFLPEGRGQALEAEGKFPELELRAFAERGLTRRLAPPELGGCLEWSRAMRICARLAEHDLDVTLCLGGAVLGAIPVLVAGSAEQRARYFGPLLAGEMGGLALSEWEHGSDLLGIATRAVGEDEGGAECPPEQAVAFRLSGEKAPINNATRGRNLVVLARTSPGKGPDPFALSLFLIPADAEGLTPLPRFPSIGYRTMDLSGIRMEGARVPASALLGKVGEGFVLVRRSLEISRSGVATMAVGPHARILSLALAHARSRVLYGAPVAELGAARRLLTGIFARLVLSAAMARRASHAVAHFPGAARAHTSAAKLLCPSLLEESVHDAGTLLGARSLMEDLPFARLRRSAPVLAIFDGSSQLQLDELYRHAASWAPPGTLSPEEATSLGKALREPSARFDADAEDRAGLLARTGPAALLGAHEAHLAGAPLPRIAELVAMAAREARGHGQPVKHRVSELVAELQGIASLLDALSLSDGDAKEPLDAALALVLATRGARMAETLVILGRAMDSPALNDLAPSLLQLAAGRPDAEERAWRVVQTL